MTAASRVMTVARPVRSAGNQAAGTSAPAISFAHAPGARRVAIARILHCGSLKEQGAAPTINPNPRSPSSPTTQYLTLKEHGYPRDCYRSPGEQAYFWRFLNECHRTDQEPAIGRTGGALHEGHA